jgi:hypothetical protein
MGSGYGWIDGKRITTANASLPSTPPTPNPPAPVPGRPPVAASSSQALTLPLAWGGSVPVAYLEQLRAPAGQSPEFLARVITGRDLYKIGDGLKVGFKASQNAEYLLLHRASTGEYTLLSPRGDTPPNLTAGTAYLLPGEQETFQVTPPVGTEELILICSLKAVDLSAAARSGTIPMGLVIARHRYQITN